MRTTGRPVLFGIDSVHGATYVDSAVLFPHSINIGATFNPTLAGLMGEYMARDTKAAGIPWLFGPTLDITRHKHWPRVYETFGETRQWSRTWAARPSRRSRASFKHFIAYSDPVDGMDRSNAVVSDYDLLNYFMPSFKAAIDVAKVMNGMGTFVAINTVPMAANERLHKQLLRGDLKFDGLMVTDFKEIQMLVEMHHAAVTSLDAMEPIIE